RTVKSEPVAAEPSAADEHRRRLESLEARVLELERELGEALESAGIPVADLDVRNALGHYREKQKHQEPPPKPPQEPPAAPELDAAKAEADSKKAVMDAK